MRIDVSSVQERRWRALGCVMAVLLIGCSPAADRGSAASSEPAARETGVLREPDVRFEPTPQRTVDRMLRLADLGPDDILYDLGSGDGRIPITAARDYGARAVGIDIDPERIAESRENAAQAGVTDRVSFRNQDLLTADVRPATVVTLFLSRDLNRKLKPILLDQLRPGTRVASYYHDMPGWRPDKTISGSEVPIYLWIIPEKVSGTGR